MPQKDKRGEIRVRRTPIQRMPQKDKRGEIRVRRAPIQGMLQKDKRGEIRVRRAPTRDAPKGQEGRNKGPQGTHKGCPYNGTHQPARSIRTIVGASLVGALVWVPLYGC